MPEEASFRDLIGKVRTGDNEAAAELVRRYEPAIRRAVRVRLVDSRLRRVLDTSDVCQSILASFFVRAAMGQYELDQPDQLLKLLARMAHNKVIDQARKHHAERRAVGRVEGMPADERDVAGTDPTPSRQVALVEILQKVRANLSEDERRLADQRADGREWLEIAAAEGGSPEALRKRLARAVDRVAQQLQLDEFTDESA